MKTLSRILFAAVLVLPVAALQARQSDHKDDSAATLIKFSDPSKPGTLKVIVPRGDVRIKGSVETSVSVTSDAEAITSEPRKDGLRVLTAAASYTLVESANVITLDASNEISSGGSSDLNIEVPVSTSVIVTNAWGGDITCEGIKGDIEIKSLHGEVKLVDIAGAALVESMNGEIDATVAQMVEGKPLSFTSVNGEVVLRVPADTKANVRLRTRNGSILTDFDDKALVTTLQVTPQPSRKGSRTSNGNPDQWKDEVREAVREAAKVGAEAAREAAKAVREASQAVREGMNDEAMAPLPPMPPLPPITGGKIVAGALNGGGTEITIATMNGDVTLRKK